MAFDYPKKYFYERNDWIYRKDINLTYEAVLKMSFEDFGKWVDYFRKTAIEQWNKTDAPPKMGKDEPEIIEAFSKLQSFKVHEFAEKDDDGDDINDEDGDGDDVSFPSFYLFYNNIFIF